MQPYLCRISAFHVNKFNFEQFKKACENLQAEIVHVNFMNDKDQCFIQFKNCDDLNKVMVLHGRQYGVLPPVVLTYASPPKGIYCLVQQTVL